ncbi:hypothetical protein Thiowin_00664 [Thiorhodovibrio winogradskyi]|uniref:Transposase n=1 Tax=Thiorhodovibrio winogradskyi TaxID=77007 RepID=A0ABZ0S5Y8_9GAMM
MIPKLCTDVFANRFKPLSLRVDKKRQIQSAEITKLSHNSTHYRVHYKRRMSLLAYGP